MSAVPQRRPLVLQLIKGLGRGGAEQIIAAAAPHFDRTRFDYEAAFVHPEKTALVPELERYDIPVHPIGSQKGPWASRLRRLVRRQGIDLVHVHSPAVAAMARTILLGTGTRLVYTEHNLWHTYHRLTYWGNLLTFGLNDHVFAVSREVADAIRYPRALGFLRGPKAEVLYHWLDLSLFDPSGPSGLRAELEVDDTVPIVGTVANFRVQKRHELLIQSARHVLATHPTAMFVLIGGGPTEQTLRDLVAREKLGENVRFLGRRDDVVELVRGFDVFALPSTYEGFPIALLEAMALERACIACDVPGVRELIEHEQNGIFADPDPESFGAAIVRLIEDREERARLGRNARERASTSDLRESVRRWESVYSDLLHGHSGHLDPGLHTTR